LEHREDTLRHRLLAREAEPEFGLDECQISILVPYRQSVMGTRFESVINNLPAGVLSDIDLCVARSECTYIILHAKAEQPDVLKLYLADKRRVLLRRYRRIVCNLASR
jgi:hypothetical protein